jgi:hypothetical protein
MPAQVHHWHALNASQTDSSEESRKRVMTYLMQFWIMTALFVLIIVAVIYTATVFPMSTLVFDEEKPMQAGTGMW